MRDGSASAKVVFVAHDGDAVISGNSKSVFFIKGDKNGNPAVNHTEEFGDYYEYDAIIGGEITKIKMARYPLRTSITATLASQLTRTARASTAWLPAIMPTIRSLPALLTPR